MQSHTVIPALDPQPRALEALVRKTSEAHWLISGGKCSIQGSPRFWLPAGGFNELQTIGAASKSPLRENTDLKRSGDPNIKVNLMNRRL